MKTVKDEVTEKRMQCRKKFLHVFPQGFYDKKYLAWERDYKWKAHFKMR